ncbi:MAG: winged helix-turn-helix domain-containing protein [Acidimicrobiales bacterium]
MEPILCYPDPPPTGLTEALERAGLAWRSVPGIEAAGPAGGWTGAVVAIGRDPDAAFAFCQHLRSRDVRRAPLLLVVPAAHLGELEARAELFDDLCVEPVRTEELALRIVLLLHRHGTEVHRDLVTHGPLVLDLETYQAAVDGRTLDLTYMEYELLRFLASRPGKVFTRETLLSRVWGYEYYGGARTVDVHVRRLRAKLGEEHAHLIQTVRSVGYRFGQTPWSP